MVQHLAISKMPTPSEISVDSSITGCHARIDQWPSAFLQSSIFFQPFFDSQKRNGRPRRALEPLGYLRIHMDVYMRIYKYVHINISASALP